MKVRPTQMSSILGQLIAGRLPALITGNPGIGKSDIVAQACDAAGARMMLWHPAVSDPTDYKGLPWPDAKTGRATFLPFGELADLIEADSPTVCFLDDLGQASPAVQAAAMQLILARRVNGHKLSEHVVFMAATNLRTDGAGVSGILTPVISRFATVLQLDPTVDDWCQWAFAHNIPPELIAFLRFRSELLLTFDPKRARDIEPFACPRTWAYAARLMQTGLSGGDLYAAIAGAVGEGPAGEFVAFLRIAHDAPNPDAILLAPDQAPIPTEPSGLYAVATALATKASISNFDRITTYCQRMHGAKRTEFAALTVRDSYRRHPEIANSPAFVQLHSTELGKLISGAN